MKMLVFISYYLLVVFKELKHANFEIADYLFCNKVRVCLWYYS